MTPFLANQSLGVDSYKWILFGEDDTVFFVSNAMKLLEHLDHNLPYLLTDNIQYPQQHINGELQLLFGCTYADVHMYPTAAKHVYNHLNQRINILQPKNVGQPMAPTSVC